MNKGLWIGLIVVVIVIIVGVVMMMNNKAGSSQQSLDSGVGQYPVLGSTPMTTPGVVDVYSDTLPQTSSAPSTDNSGSAAY